LRDCGLAQRAGRCDDSNDSHFNPLFWSMEPVDEILALPGDMGLISQIKEFAGFFQVKCT
jgi:hypothetical protein